MIEQCPKCLEFIEDTPHYHPDCLKTFCREIATDMGNDYVFRSLDYMENTETWRIAWDNRTEEKVVYQKIAFYISNQEVYDAWRFGLLQETLYFKVLGEV